MATTDRALAHLIGKTYTNYVEWVKNVEAPSALSESGGSVMIRVPTGTTQVLPAPPAGYANCLVNINAKNAGTLALSFRLTDSDGELWGAHLLDAGHNAVQELVISDKQLSLTVSGSGTPLEFQCEYHTITKPGGWALGVVKLTTAYQVIPSIVPTRGTTRVWPISGARLWNGDSADVQVDFRHTRGNLVFEWAQGADAGVKVQRYSQGVLPSPVVLQPGDKLEVKSRAMTNSWLRYYVEQLVI